MYLDIWIDRYKDVYRHPYIPLCGHRWLVGSCFQSRPSLLVVSATWGAHVTLKSPMKLHSTLSCDYCFQWCWLPAASSHIPTGICHPCGARDQVCCSPPTCCSSVQLLQHPAAPVRVLRDQGSPQPILSGGWLEQGWCLEGLEGSEPQSF